MEDQKNKPDNVAKMLENIKPQTVTIRAESEPSGERSVLLVPKGMDMKSIKPLLDEYRKKPERRKETVNLDRLYSFVDVTNRFKSENSVVFAKGSVTQNSITASLTTIFDYHPKNSNVEDADNCDHKAHYSFPVSKEMNFWLTNNAEPMDQIDFALLLEERICEMAVANDEDISAIANLKPKFAEPLEIKELADSLEIYSEETFQQSNKISSGEREVKFTAQHNGADGKPISVPDFFMLNIPIFEGEDAVRIAVRLRYRKQGERIIWFYDLYRVDQVFDVAFSMAIEKVESQTELPLFLGSA